jgi:kynurenine formamidase
MRPEQGNWGRWGDEDEAGAANLLTPERLLASLAIPTEGRVHHLGQMLQSKDVPMGLDNGRPLHYLTLDGGDYADESHAERAPFHVSSDYLGLHTHGMATHLDSLGHMWRDGTMYNGWESETVHSWGMRRLGIEKAGPFITRGVLLDVAGHLGVTALAPSYEITPDELEGAARAADVEIRPGDAVIIRTGMPTTFSRERPEAYGHLECPGIGPAAGQWLADRDICLVGADNPGIEVTPPPDGSSWFSVHNLLLRDYGIFLLELLDLEEFVAVGAPEFLFVAAPLRLRGGTGSPITPLAIV